MNILLRPWQHYFDFSGRSRRTEYFLFYICWYAAMALAVMLAIAIVGNDVESGSDGISMAMIAGAGLLFAAGIIPGLAVTVRRLHDQDKSAWFILVNLIPYVGGLIMLVLSFLPGTDGENQYGPDPRNPMGTTADVFS